MKQLLRLGIAIFGFLALGTFLISLTQARKLYIETPGDDAPSLSYHFSLYLPDNRNSFFTGIITGAERAAAELNAAVSIHSIDPAKYELEMAVYTGIDGAIVCPYLEDAPARRQLEKLEARQIPVVLINHNIPNDQPWPFIGANTFDIGRRMGNIAGNINGGDIELAVVYSDKSPGIYGERELVEMGIITALGGRLGSPIIGLKTSLNPLDAEELMYRLFRSNPGINTVIFTDSNDTLAAAQTLVDMNLVGRVQIIGFGDDPAIQENIRKGVITSSILTDPDRIGYEAVRSLAALRATGYTPASIDTGVRILDGDSL
jgi:ribose transport system substrate-binding protein